MTTASNASSLAEAETEKEAKVEIQEAVITAAIHEKDKDEEDVMQENGGEKGINDHTDAMKATQVDTGSLQDAEEDEETDVHKNNSPFLTATDIIDAEPNIVLEDNSSTLPTNSNDENDCNGQHNNQQEHDTTVNHKQKNPFDNGQKDKQVEQETLASGNNDATEKNPFLNGEEDEQNPFLATNNIDVVGPSIVVGDVVQITNDNDNDDNNGQNDDDEQTEQDATDDAQNPFLATADKSIDVEPSILVDDVLLTSSNGDACNQHDHFSTVAVKNNPNDAAAVSTAISSATATKSPLSSSASNVLFHVRVSFGLLTDKKHSPLLSPLKESEDGQETSTTTNYKNHDILNQCMSATSVLVQDALPPKGEEEEEQTIFYETSLKNHPFVISAKPDVLYHPPTNRSNIVRSIVVADIPLCSTSNNTSWMKKAQESVVHTLQQAVAEGTFLSAAANRQK